MYEIEMYTKNYFLKMKSKLKITVVTGQLSEIKIGSPNNFVVCRFSSDEHLGDLI